MAWRGGVRSSEQALPTACRGHAGGRARLEFRISSEPDLCPGRRRLCLFTWADLQRFPRTRWGTRRDRRDRSRPGLADGGQPAALSSGRGRADSEARCKDSVNPASCHTSTREVLHRRSSHSFSGPECGGVAFLGLGRGMGEDHAPAVCLCALAHPARSRLSETDCRQLARTSGQEPARARYGDSGRKRIQSAILCVLLPRMSDVSLRTAREGRAVDVSDAVREAWNSAAQSGVGIVDAVEKRWIIAPVEESPIPGIDWREICDQPCIAELLKRKGFRSADEVNAFLQPRLSSLSDPFLLPNMAVAVGRILKAIDNRERIVL